MEPTKFSIHFLNDGFDTARDLLGMNKTPGVPMVMIKFAQMATVWIQDPNKIALLNQAKKNGSLVMGRRVEDPPNIDAPDMLAEARRYFDGINTSGFAVMAKTFPQVDVWEGPNEIGITMHDNGIERMTKYAKFLYEFARLMREETGKLSGIGGWAVGNPELPLWAYYSKALQATKDFAAILTRHSYGPTPVDSYLTMRHRLDEGEFNKLGFVNSPVYISECGYDPLDNKKIAQDWKHAFKDIYGYWNNYLLPFTNALQADTNVVGASLFTCGNGGASAFDRFDVAHLPLADAVLKNYPTIHVAPPPPPPVVPAPTYYPKYMVSNCEFLNVRANPWTVDFVAPQITASLPPQVKKGDIVTSFATVKFGYMLYPWHLIGPNGDRWVSGYYLTKI